MISALKSSSRTRGIEGENKAAFALEQGGMRIIARNVRSKCGEVDIVGLDGASIVFVEVKNWPAYELQDLEYGISLKKRHRIIETAKDFLHSHREYNDRSIRFDVVFIGSGTLTHLVSAFMENL